VLDEIDLVVIGILLARPTAVTQPENDRLAS